MSGVPKPLVGLVGGADAVDEHEPPAHLSERSAAFWRRTAGEYDLEEHRIELLTAACEAMDRRDDAREQIERDGAVIENRFGESKPHPALAIENASAVRLARLLRELRLDEGAPDARPPRGRRSR